jgi:GNAT superfamily N-acetyltransferase
VSELRIEPAQDDAALADWRRIHNLIIPIAPLSAEEVLERAERNRLEVAYLDGEAIGCSTVRPPEGPNQTVTVIARVLPEHRRQGYGTTIYVRALEHARTLAPGRIETIVWAANTAGLRFAGANGFTEVSRYLPPGEDIPFVTLRLGGS